MEGIKKTNVASVRLWTYFVDYVSYLQYMWELFEWFTFPKACLCSLQPGWKKKSLVRTWAFKESDLPLRVRPCAVKTSLCAAVDRLKDSSEFKRDTKRNQISDNHSSLPCLILRKQYTLYLNIFGKRKHTFFFPSLGLCGFLTVERNVISTYEVLLEKIDCQ